MSKVFGSETFQRVADTGMKVLGLYGLLTEDDRWAPLAGRIQDAWRHSFSNTIAAGTSEIQREHHCQSRAGAAPGLTIGFEQAH